METNEEINAKRVSIEILERYKLLGEDFEVFNYGKIKNQEISTYVKIKYISDDFFINVITYLNNNPPEFITSGYFINVYHDIYIDILCKRRINKIIKLKSIINEKYNNIKIS